jgi:hypothetical protein
VRIAKNTTAITTRETVSQLGNARMNAEGTAGARGARVAAALECTGGLYLRA